MLRISIIIITILSLSSCYYDSKEFLFPEVNTGCNTSNVTFSGSVKPILSQYCYRCHSTANASILGNGFKLEDYNDVLPFATNGSLYGSVAHLSGYVPMPQDGGMLSNCNIAIIKAWIDDGSPDN